MQLPNEKSAEDILVGSPWTSDIDRHCLVKNFFSKAPVIKMLIAEIVPMIYGNPAKKKKDVSEYLFKWKMRGTMFNATVLHAKAGTRHRL